MMKYISGFVVGIMMCIAIFLVFIFFGTHIADRLGFCPDLTEAEKLALVKRSTIEKLIIPRFSEAEFEVADNGETVYIIQNGKRIERHFPIVFCGRVEWSFDQTFNEQK